MAISAATARSSSDMPAGVFESMSAADLVAGLPPRTHLAFETTLRSIPDHVAFIEGNDAWTFRRFGDAVEAVTADLTALGVRAGDRVMLASENCVAVGAFLVATSKIDAWLIVANPRLSARELDLIYGHSGARRQFFTTAVSTEAADHAARVGATVRAVGPFEGLGVGALNDAAVPKPVKDNAATQVAVLIYTSGTTGTPKGVMLTHENLLFSARVSGLLRQLSPHDRIYGVLPMSHIVGLTVILVSSLMFGATVRVVAKADPTHLAQTLATGGATILYGVPATYQRLPRALDDERRHSALRCTAMRLRRRCAARSHAEDARRESAGYPAHKRLRDH